MIGAVEPAAAFAGALAGEPWRLRLACGTEVAVPFELYTGEPTGADRRLLERTRGPVIDIGCGPGRHVGHLARRGVPAIGIDVSRAAVRLARRRGAPAVLRSVFGDVPGEGTWGTALLLDGNIGIGGDPTRLLRRVGTLLAPGAQVLVECAAGASTARPGPVRLVGPGGVSTPFEWAVVASGELAGVAARAGLALADAWCDEGRHFAVLLAP